MTICTAPGKHAAAYRLYYGRIPGRARLFGPSSERISVRLARTSSVRAAPLVGRASRRLSIRLVSTGRASGVARAGSTRLGFSDRACGRRASVRVSVGAGRPGCGARRMSPPSDRACGRRASNRVSVRAGRTGCGAGRISPPLRAWVRSLRRSGSWCHAPGRFTRAGRTVVSLL